MNSIRPRRPIYIPISEVDSQLGRLRASATNTNQGPLYIVEASDLRAETGTRKSEAGSNALVVVPEVRSSGVDRVYIVRFLAN